MKPLQMIQQVLTWICGVPPNEFDSKRERVAYIGLTLSIVIVHSLALTAGAVFIYRNVSINFEESLFSLFHDIGSASMLYQSVVVILLCRELAAVFEGLSEIYKENEIEDSFPILMDPNKKCEWICQLYLKYVLGGFIAITIMTCITSIIFCYIIRENIETEGLYHPFRFVLPWNQSTLFGYVLEIFFGLFGGEAYFIANGSLLVLFISMCLHHQTFYKMFRNEVSKLNNRDKHRIDAEHLRKLICFHISVKDWFLDSAKTYSPFILVELISSMLFLACSVFQFDLQMKHLDYNILVISTGVLAGTSNLFAYCYLGKMATHSYENMAKCLYDCNWHELSPKLQKYIVVMMANAQRPVYYDGFGVAVLNLETFTKMIRAVYSYYMIFKTLASD